MTPKEYASRYWTLDVYMQAPKDAEYPAVVVHPAASLYFALQSMDLPGGLENAADSLLSDDHGLWRRTRVASYRLHASTDENGKSYRDPFDNAVSDHKNFSVKVKRIDGQIETKTFAQYDRTTIMYSATTAFSGKGYPEEAQVTLQLRYRYQKTVLGLDAFTKAHFIGLDCNGFVGGYLKRRNDAANWLRKPEDENAFGPSTTITQIMTDKVLVDGTMLSAMDDLKPPGARSIVLAMCTGDGTVVETLADGTVGHIMITEPNTMRKEGDQIVVEVVESTAAQDLGLVASQYRIQSVTAASPKNGLRNSVFKILRHGTPMNVVMKELSA